MQKETEKKRYENDSVDGNHFIPFGEKRVFSNLTRLVDMCAAPR